MDNGLNELQEKIQYRFKNISLLERAVTHSSYANEKHLTTGDNERLEFLGDSVLGFITAEYLFSHHRNFPEGELTRLRSYAVCEKSLFEYAKEIDLGDRLLLGKGEEMTGGRTRPSVVSDAFEAVIAAIYIDGGIGEAKNSFCASSSRMLRQSRPLRITRPYFRRSFKKSRRELKVCSCQRERPRPR